jgi:hypothetical protein
MIPRTIYLQLLLQRLVQHVVIDRFPIASATRHPLAPKALLEAAMPGGTANYPNAHRFCARSLQSIVRMCRQPVMRVVEHCVIFLSRCVHRINVDDGVRQVMQMMQELVPDFR